MKRDHKKPSNQSDRPPRAIEPRRLATVRGGASLGILVASRLPTDDIMQQQHNEALIRL